MIYRGYIREFSIALAILAVCIPLAVVLTIASSPLWSWVEEKFRIEAYGHSGPADWCYLVTYCLLVAICILIRLRSISRKLRNGVRQRRHLN